MSDPQQDYWDEIADEYQSITSISTQAFHLGPLLPCATKVGLLTAADWKGKRCLEVGAGAGQNSIFLTHHGAICTATDISPQQLKHGRSLAKEEGVEVTYKAASLDSLDCGTDWDLVHSTYALPFAQDWQAALTGLCEAVAPGGQLMVTTGHPIFAGEFLEVDEEGEGMFLRDYFNPPPDARFAEDGSVIAARCAPVGALIQTVIDAGLTITAVAEPKPIALPELTEPTLVPYYSEAWAELYPQLATMPVVITIKASKPA